MEQSKITNKISQLASDLKDECLKEKIVAMVILVDRDTQDNITYLQGHTMDLLISITAAIHTLVEHSNGTMTLDDAMEILGEMTNVVKDDTYHSFSKED